MHTMTFMFDPEQAVAASDVQAAAVGGVRMTCAMLALRKLPLFHQLEEQARAAVRELYQVGDKKPLPPESAAVLGLLSCWARGMATTVKVETCAPGRGAEEGDWHPSSLAALGWDTAAGALDLPASLLSAWDRVAVASNPGLWAAAGGALPEKKVGMISVV